MSVKPCAATFSEQMHSRTSGVRLEALHLRVALGRRVVAQDVRGVGEALHQVALHGAVGGEDDELLAAGQEVVDPRVRGVQLADARRAGAAR